MAFNDGLNSVLGGFQYVQGQVDKGIADRRKSTLEQLAGQYYGGQVAPEQRGQFLSQVAQNGGDPGRYMQQDDQELKQAASILLSAPEGFRQQVYDSQIAPRLKSKGYQVPPYSPEVVQLAQGLVGQGGGQPASLQEFAAMTQGLSPEDALKARRINLGLDPRALAPQVFDTGNGVVGIDRAGYRAAPISMGQSPQAAPPQGTNNQVLAVANAMAQAGVPAQQIEAWMAKQPGIGPASAAPAAPQLQTAPKPQAAPSGYRFNPDGSLTTIPGGPADQSAAGAIGDTTKTGKDYLATLKPQEATQVQALAEGRMAFPSGAALKSPYWQQMLSAVSQYDPNFDAVNYNARVKTRQAFTSGKEAQIVNALNTVAEHLGTFSDNAMALGNTGLPVYNRLKNFALEQSGDPRIASFNTAKKAVADEVAKVWRASGGSEADIQENLKNLDGAQSPEQLNAAIGTLTELINGKVMALQDQYTSGMGTSQTPRPLVSPEAQKAFDKTMRRKNGQPEPAASSKPGWSIQKVN